MLQDYEILVYSNEKGDEPFTEWVNSLKDERVKAALFMRVQRFRVGNFGDFKYFEGLYELRVDFGPGYRIYCAKIGNKLILLLGGGDKRAQERDIKRCKVYLEEHKRRM